MLSERSQTEKDKYYMISLACGIPKPISQKEKIDCQDIGEMGEMVQEYKSPVIR